MQSARRAIMVRLPSLAQWPGPTQQAAALATAAKPPAAKAPELGSGDGKMQAMLRALQPQEVEPLDMSPEELAEAERRCAGSSLSRSSLSSSSLSQACLPSRPPRLPPNPPPFLPNSTGPRSIAACG